MTTDRRADYPCPKQQGGLGYIDALTRRQQARQGQHGNDPICLPREINAHDDRLKYPKSRKIITQ